MELLANTGYVLYLVSYSVTEIMWLRLITIMGAVLTIPYFYFQPGGTLWTSLFWALMFGLINAIQVVRLVLARRPVGLDRDERWIYDNLFSRFDAREFTKLLALGEWIDADEERVLITAHEVPDRLMLLVSGAARVSQDRHELALMRPGQFIGELAFITNEPASATVTARPGVRCFAWPVEPLRAHLDQHPPISDALLQILGVDVATKLRERNIDTRATQTLLGRLPIEQER